MSSLKLELTVSHPYPDLVEYNPGNTEHTPCLNIFGDHVTTLCDMSNMSMTTDHLLRDEQKVNFQACDWAAVNKPASSLVVRFIV